MISKIRNSRSFKGICIMLSLMIFFEITFPNNAFALTGGPAQPEFSSFTPIGTSDMVDLSSGDMSYNIPLMDVGGYPLNIAYSSGIGMDDEASWVGLGWNLSVGQINRNVRGIPDDFNGDKIQYENHLKKNITVGTTFKFIPHLTGVDIFSAVNAASESDISVSVGLSLIYNNYTGPAMKPSIGVTLDLTNCASVGLNVESGPDGLCVSPNLSLHAKTKTKAERDKKTTASFGLAFNSRQGLSAMTLNVSKKHEKTITKTIDEKTSVTKVKKGSRSLGSTIGFAEQLYTPSKRVGMSTQSFTFNGALGGEIFGGEGQGQITGFGTIMTIRESEKNKEVSSYGYAHTDNAGRTAILDFNREKDGNFSVNSTNLPLTNYTYDIYSVQGQGVSGMYRPFRNQVGFIYDSEVFDNSTSGSLGLEFGSGNAFHAGVDLEVSSSDGHSGLWDQDNYILVYLKENYDYNPNYEKVHYKNVGDLSVDKDFVMFNSVGNYNAVRVQYIGNKFNRRAVNELKKKISWNGSENLLGVGSKIKRTKRQLRNQAIQNLTVAQINAGVGYGPVAYGEETVNSEAKGHHVGEVQITRNDGARYIYGLPAYNTLKREATFATAATGDCNTGLVGYNPNAFSSPTSLPNDQYFNRITTPAYVHTHLLTSILSTDYQDVTGNGPTADDLGSYTKFVYKKIPTPFQWRVPFTKGKANYNEGSKTDDKDNQGNYVYGVKELFYIDTIKTKTHLAIFHTSARDDARGVDSEAGSLNNSSTTGSISYKLDSIQLFSVGEYYNENGGVNTNAIPIKTAHFVYDYSLCKGVPNNIVIGKGKLTLKKVYFEYRNSKMGKYTPYQFGYDAENAVCNPDYNIKGYDTWGNYKPNDGTCANSDPTLNAPEFPYTCQDPVSQNQYAAVWTLRNIKLPSGGEIDITYESDDYSFVQDKPVQRMFFVRGAGDDAVPTDISGDIGELFTLVPNTHNKYLYVEVEGEETTYPNIVYNEYLSSLENRLIYFRFLVNMTMQGGISNSNVDNSKFDYVTGYAEFDHTKYNDLKVINLSGKKILILPIKLVDKEGGLNPAEDVNPIAKAGWNFGRKYLSNHVFSNQPNGDSEDIGAIIPELIGNITNLVEIFTGPNGALENRNICRRFIKNKSWIRLREHDQVKLGGGSRVKEVRMTDKWSEMTDLSGYFDMSYGQKYEYTLGGNLSSGVASYEPIGNKENPFVQPVYSTINHILAPDEENFVEKPFGESFFPNPQVTYSRIKVSSLQLGTAPSSILNPQVKKLHRTGSVVTEFYTTKDYPTIVDQTKLEVNEDKKNPLASLLKITMKKHLIASQGYVIHLNDMNGKQKSQRVYAEGQSDFISGVDYNYENYDTPANNSSSSAIAMNAGKLNNKVRVINPNGTIEMKTIGVEVDVINDFRENGTVSEVVGTNANLATFFIGMIPAIIPIPLPDYTKSEDQFRSVSTTKVINTFGILKETVAYDAGAKVYTRNLAWDASTGEVLVTETVDEFNDKYYTMNYPAHWYYKGMAQASKNLGLKGKLQVNGLGLYSMQGVSSSSNYLIEGDELMVENTKAWVVNLQGNQFNLIDKDGIPLSFQSDDEFFVYRSGHRNLQSAGIMNVTLHRNPLKAVNGSDLSSISPTYLNSTLSGENWNVINAGAVDYSDYWKVGCECGVDLLSGTYNPYFRNERGVWRTKSSRTYLSGRKYQEKVTPRKDGYFTNFSPMYKTSLAGNWIKDLTNWTFVAEVSRYSPYGFELENMDALDRYSAAQYGYNQTFPMAVGANTEYRQIGYDGFEDYDFNGCSTDAHFNFKDVITSGDINNENSHTGRYSLKVGSNAQITLNKILSCETAQP